MADADSGSREMMCASRQTHELRNAKKDGKTALELPLSSSNCVPLHAWRGADTSSRDSMSYRRRARAVVSIDDPARARGACAPRQHTARAAPVRRANAAPHSSDSSSWVTSEHSMVSAKQ